MLVKLEWLDYRMVKKNYDYMLSRFHLILERYGRTDRRTDRFCYINISRASVCWCAIKIVFPPRCATTVWTAVQNCRGHSRPLTIVCTVRPDPWRCRHACSDASSRFGARLVTVRPRFNDGCCISLYAMLLMLHWNGALCCTTSSQYRAKGDETSSQEMCEV